TARSSGGRPLHLHRCGRGRWSVESPRGALQPEESPCPRERQLASRTQSTLAIVPPATLAARRSRIPLREHHPFNTPESRRANALAGAIFAEPRLESLRQRDAEHQRCAPPLVR